MKINLDNVIFQTGVEELKNEVLKADALLKSREGKGSDFLGWIDLPVDFDKEELERIKLAAEKIKKNSDVLLAIGIGGSYLGAKMVMEALANPFKKNKPEVIFIGHHLSSTEMFELREYLEDKDFSINVISKSGTTTEPAVAFRLFKALLEEKYSEEEVRDRIFATTDKKKGALKTLATNNGFETFVVPDNIGGRFSVLTAVGLLPLATLGVNVDELLKGARDYREFALNTDFEENDVLKYVAIRNHLLRQGKDVEIMVSYDPKLAFFSEWWKQLFGESEGKENKGIFPASVVFTTDLHSLGQIIQEGQRNIFETVINVKTPKYDLAILSDDEDLDGLNYLVGKTVDEVNKVAMEATIEAHVTGNVPNIKLDIEKIDEYNLGKLIYFFEYAVGVSGYTLDVNPFDQPGVEEYKNNMFRLLEKPGY